MGSAMRVRALDFAHFGGGRSTSCTRLNFVHSQHPAGACTKLNLIHSRQTLTYEHTPSQARAHTHTHMYVGGQVAGDNTLTHTCTWEGRWLADYSIAVPSTSHSASRICPLPRSSLSHSLTHSLTHSLAHSHVTLPRRRGYTCRPKPDACPPFCPRGTHNLWHTAAQTLMLLPPTQSLAHAVVTTQSLLTRCLSRSCDSPGLPPHTLMPQSSHAHAKSSAAAQYFGLQAAAQVPHTLIQVCV